MDISELPTPPQPSAAAAAPASEPTPQEWRELVAQIGRETAAPLSAAVELINAFASTGKIDRAGLRTIREAMDRARRIGVMAQQISRFASGRVQPSPERLNLSQVVQDVLAQRRRETQARGIELRASLAPAEADVDAALLSAVLQAMLDWGFEHARSHISITLDVKTWPEHARLTCQFAHVLPDVLPGPSARSGRAAHDVADKLDSMPWQLLRRLAQTSGLLLQRDDSAGDTRLTLEFPGTAADALITLTGLDAAAAVGGAHNSQPMTGSHALVIASRRETRAAIRDAVRAMGLMVDYVGSVEEARGFCAASLPRAVIYEAGLAGARFQQLCRQWTAEAPTLVLIEIAEDGRNQAVSDLAGLKTLRIGREGVLSLLPAALLAELAQAA
jgi:hypothetical protein